MTELALKVENLKKQYRLGVIGGGTLYGDLQSWWAKIRGKEDPNTQIGTDVDTKKGSFYALKGISFEVKKGERLGIIGGNGAGKSTTLKILSRVTAPTEGTVYINGRISSMLEVGTGFHAELTGRENIYLNGAILGMSKTEVDEKIEDIIEFSECRQFIDTPVKRYSSGMYVKLAFAVAAHLDSESLIMDEVLAVGDMAFQNKCLKKMQEVSEKEGRTVLYVSHNMNTIRQLCDRCIVLDKGELIFDGAVEEAIEVYLGCRMNYEEKVYLEDLKRAPEFSPHPVTMQSIESLNGQNGIYQVGTNLHIKLILNSERDVKDAYIRIIIKTLEGSPVTMITTEQGIYIERKKEQEIEMKLDTSKLAPGRYTISPVIYEVNELGVNVNLDGLKDVYGFEIISVQGFNNNMVWQNRYWGNHYAEPIDVKKVN